MALNDAALTVGRTYSVTNRIVTTGGRTDERSLTLRVADR